MIGNNKTKSLLVIHFNGKTQNILDDEEPVSSNLVGNKLISSFKLFSPEKDSRNKSFRNSLVFKTIVIDSLPKDFVAIKSFFENWSLQRGVWSNNRFDWPPMVVHIRFFNINDLFQITFI